MTSNLLIINKFVATLEEKRVRGQFNVMTVYPLSIGGMKNCSVNRFLKLGGGGVQRPLVNCFVRFSLTSYRIVVEKKLF